MIFLIFKDSQEMKQCLSSSVLLDLIEKLFVTVLRVSDPPPGMHKASLLACGSQGGHSLNVHLSLGHMSRLYKGPSRERRILQKSARCG